MLKEANKSMNIIDKIKNVLNPHWTLVYAPNKSVSGFTHQTYSIDNPHEAAKLYTKGVNTGFVTKAHNRKGIRAFRYDRIVSLSCD